MTTLGREKSFSRPGVSWAAVEISTKYFQLS